jgi:hypothetical protein
MRRGETRNVNRVLIGNSRGKRHLKRPRHRWEENVQIVLDQIGNETMEWIQLPHVRIQ